MVIKLLILGFTVVAMLLAVNRVPLRYNLRNLSARWRTTIMTAAAFTAVIALVTVMLAFVAGMQRLTQSTGNPCNLMVLADGATDEAFSNLAVGDLADIEHQPYVQQLDGRPFSSRETFVVVNQPVLNYHGGGPKRRFLQVRGIDDPLLAARVHDMRLLPGGVWFSSSGVQQLSGASEGATAVQAVLGEGVARELGRDRSDEELARAKNRSRLDVGDEFFLGGRTWIVSGVLKSTGSTFNSEIWAKRSLVATTFGKDTYTTLVLRTPSPAVARTFRKYLSEDYEKAAVNAQVETDYYSNLSETSEQFLYAIGFLAVVMSVGGVFGVMNTMFAAISQRTKDIGVLQLLGYSRRQILISFLLESLVIALIGGLMGCALGSLAHGWQATSVVSSGAGGKSVALELTVEAWILAVGILITLGMGLLGGLLPAGMAMNKRAIEALR